jgi:hypothetical protein
LILKAFYKDADLRDPMGWMFSRLRCQKSEKENLQAQACIRELGKNIQKTGYNSQKTRTTDFYEKKDLVVETSVADSNIGLSETKMTPLKIKKKSIKRLK